MTILLFVTHKHDRLTNDTLKTLNAARAFQQPIDLFLAGAQNFSETSPLYTDISQLGNIRQILYSQSPAFENFLAEPLSETLFSLKNDYDIFISSANSIGKNIFPRLAALLDVMQISNVTEILSENTFKKPIYSGSAIATVKSYDPKKIITVQSAAFAKIKEPQSQKDTKKLPSIQYVKPAEDRHLSIFVKAQKTNESALDLNNAKIIIAGGRGFGTAEDFDRLLKRLAKKLNAAIGASRAAVDAGYAPNEWQIGQTGKIVAPELYIAVGISGAMQHIAGMKDSNVIVAINQDPDAPIFHIADYGIIGDLFKILPEIEKAL